MGKVKAPAKRSKANVSPTWSWFLGLPVVVSLLWAVGRSVISREKRSVAKPEVAPNVADFEDQRLAMAKSALFGGQGFSNPEYWDNTYKQSEGHFDWYGTWLSGVQGVPHTALRAHIAPHLLRGPQTVTLNLGCGNSKLAEEMHSDGFVTITNVDISTAVVEKMRARNAHLNPQMTYLQMDISNMSFANEKFDLVIEKGTLDALYTGSPHLIPQIVDGAWRILRPGGYLVSISFGASRARWQLFKPPSFLGWANRTKYEIPRHSRHMDGNVGPGDVFYIYMLRKGFPDEAVPPLEAHEQEDKPRRRRQPA
eukprot:TRINITY_DN30214_c0_g1_i1.p1 TRINITY_DN30214_c0_g1~~TRINITY_DN30214_c0_g1_i1.p1  ORF type:complete len:310 (-),score=26.83 TRINITY_DN30214_c0_g1_i1:28-957(-)